MTLLLDTHALLWFLEDSSNLSLKAKLAIEDDSNVCLVSMASGWEMVIKTTLGKLTPPIGIQYLFPAELERLGFSILPIEPPHLHRLLTLPPHHRDPFDRMIVAQALSAGLTVVGNDGAFDVYGVQRVW